MFEWFAKLPFAAGMAVMFGIIFTVTIALVCLLGCVCPCAPCYGCPKDMVWVIREEWAERKAKKRARRTARNEAKAGKKAAKNTPPDAATPIPQLATVTAPAADTGSNSKSNSSDQRANRVPGAVSTSIFEPPPSPSQPPTLPSSLPPVSAPPIGKSAPEKAKPTTVQSREPALATARERKSVKILDKATGKVAAGVSAADVNAAIEDGLQREQKDDESVDDVHTDWGATQPLERSGEEESREKQAKIPSLRSGTNPSLKRSKPSRGRNTTGTQPEK